MNQPTLEQSPAPTCQVKKGQEEEEEAGAVCRPSRCRWSLAVDRGRLTPHRQVAADLSSNRASRIHENVLECVGGTPLVRLRNLAHLYGVKCQLLAKCEFLNPGGSIKDRIAWRMVEDAERQGRLVPHAGYTLIEPTSGNTGIGLALVAAVRGYRCLIVMPRKMSQEKEAVLRALGAQIERTPTEAAYDAPDSHISRAIELARATPKSLLLNQYRSSGNPLAHYDQTAEELLAATSGRLHCLVAGAGTGGTLSGLARKLRERASHCTLVGVDPVGSILAQPAELNELPPGAGHAYEVEGIGYDFVPTVLDRELIDRWYKSSDADSFKLARELIRHEGLLVGGSSGAAMWAALRAVEELGLKEDPSKQVVVILPDGVRNYMSKFLDDDWMRERNFLSDDNDQ